MNLVVVPSKYAYLQEFEIPSEFFSSKRFEEFIISKGFMILEYFVQQRFCLFLLLQLPEISETVMVSINRQKYPIDVSTSSYKKTEIERIKVEKDNDELLDYENVTLDGFELHHTLEVMGDTNVQQKNLAYYIKRQLLRFTYITKNIEIKTGIIMNQILGVNDTIYHLIERTSSKEFYPVITLEILFSKTFMLSQNLPVFYKKFYHIVNQSNVNKINSLENSLLHLLQHIKVSKTKFVQHMTLENDQQRVKNILLKISENERRIESERLIKSIDPITASFHAKRLDQEKKEHEEKRTECNTIYMEIKREYDQHVFNNEIAFYELFSKIQDIESLLSFIQ